MLCSEIASRVKRDIEVILDNFGQLLAFSRCSSRPTIRAEDNDNADVGIQDDSLPVLDCSSGEL